MNKERMSLVIQTLLLLTLLSITILIPNARETASPKALVYVLLIMEIIYIFKISKSKEKIWSNSVIFSIILIILITWDIISAKLGISHPVLIPPPENVFAVFSEDASLILEGIISSLQILFIGLFFGITLGTSLGLICGWYKSLKDIFYPIANVLAPIPAVVFSPYIVALMPNFRSASIVVLFLGVFWPAFLRGIIMAGTVDSNIIDLAESLGIRGISVVFEIILPYSVPKILNSLSIQLTMTVMALTFAEMIGSTSGMGHYIINWNTYGQYTKVIAGIIVVGVVVTLLNLTLNFLEKRLIKWKYY